MCFCRENFVETLYPSELMEKFIGACGASETFRELSYETKDGRVSRYLSLARVRKENSEGLGSWLADKKAMKLDMGAMYRSPISAIRDLGPEKEWAWREVVLDIDANDYDENGEGAASGTAGGRADDEGDDGAEEGGTSRKRHCKCASTVCALCWPLLQFAMIVIDAMCDRILGVSNYFFVYSGRRGIHLWLNDAEFLSLNKEARNGFLRVLRDHRQLGALLRLSGGEVQLGAKCRNVTMPLPMDGVKRRLQTMEDAVAFVALWTLEAADKFYGSLTKGSAVDALVGPAAGKVVLPGSDRKKTFHWRRFRQECASDNVMEKLIRKLGIGEKKIRFLDRVLKQFYPPFDEHVTTDIKHLLKLPFAAHPKTGHIAVPIDIDFDPTGVCASVELPNAKGTPATRRT